MDMVSGKNPISSSSRTKWGSTSPQAQGQRVPDRRSECLMVSYVEQETRLLTHVSCRRREQHLLFLHIHIRFHAFRLRQSISWDLVILFMRFHGEDCVFGAASDRMLCPVSHDQTRNRSRGRKGDREDDQFAPLLSLSASPMSVSGSQSNPGIEFLSRTRSNFRDSDKWTPRLCASGKCVPLQPLTVPSPSLSCLAIGCNSYSVSSVLLLLSLETRLHLLSSCRFSDPRDSIDSPLTGCMHLSLFSPAIDTQSTRHVFRSYSRIDDALVLLFLCTANGEAVVLHDSVIY